jgi:hypothetical protein
MPPEMWNPEYDRNMRTYMMNTQHFQTEDDYVAAQTVGASVRWLEQNATNFQHLSGPDRGAGPCLYDLEADPGEKTNVIGQHAQLAAEMRGQIADRLKQKLPVVAPGPG